jgi:hypothetical protein
MAVVAGGGAVSAALLAAAGLVLDWYYEDLALKKLGPRRYTEGADPQFFNSVARVNRYFTVGAHMSDEAYDTTTHTQVVRIDPFFFTARSDINMLKDDTAAQRSLTNALIPPLLQNIATQNKTLVLLPASISQDSATHIQQAMPEFYFRIVNRNHSHAELWAVRRGFEMMAARQVASTDSLRSVVMVGGNVRQVSKIPNVIANYGPKLSGRDEARHLTKGTVNQRQLFRQLTVDEKFGANPKRFESATCVSFYSAQDIPKEDFLKACIASGIRRAIVALNIPVIMMDDRVTEWDDQVLNARYTRRGDKLFMSPINLPVAGYMNDFESTMSWVKPHRPITGYDVTLSAVAQVGSSYLLEVEFGQGAQEEYETIWRMPDAGYYVLNDLTRDSGDKRFYTVPAQKFDQVVKFVMQLNAAKNQVEATAGRMLGLEAQIKLGGVTLERAWEQDHRKFASTMIHALLCAGLDKSDALLMMGRLREHFTDFNTKTFWRRICDGYVKLLGWQSDARLPDKAHRGAADYDVVKHWICHQKAGYGHVGQALDGTTIDAGSKTGSQPSDPDEPKDEGYVSKEDLDKDDADTSSEVSDESPSAHEAEVSLVDKMTKWLKVGKDAVDEKGKEFSGFEVDDATKVLCVTPEDAAALVTTSPFQPDEHIAYGSPPGSKCDEHFKNAVASDHDLMAKLGSNDVIYAPDVGSSRIVEASLKIDRRKVSDFWGLTKPVVNSEPRGAMEELEASFFAEVGDDPTLTCPSLLIDGISGSAKSSTVRLAIRSMKLSAAIVTPTRSLAKEWKSHHVGTTVTKHKLKLSTLRGRSVLVIDEVYAYTRQELYALLWKSNEANVKVILLGDRRQQYEDGGELTFQDLRGLQTPVMRMCVSNTMPIDSLKIAKWASSDDPDEALFQTRNERAHSIFVKQKDQACDRELLLRAAKSQGVLVFKDRLQVPIDYETLEPEDLGFSQSDPESWLSISRTQGMRTPHSLLITSRRSAIEKWFRDQPGLAYVAFSRHSRTMLWLADQYDLNLLVGLDFTSVTTVNGRLALHKNREKFAAPATIVTTFAPRQSKVLDLLAKQGHAPQVHSFKSFGPIREDWRPWHKFNTWDPEQSRLCMAAAASRLVGDTVPYAETDAVKYPVYQRAMGLWSLRRPLPWSQDQVDSYFPGMNRVAVLQNSKDEVLDQKNVIERTARPRMLDESPFRVRAQAQVLFEGLRDSMFDLSRLATLSKEPSADDWSATRTSDFANKLENADHYGITAYSVRSMGFLKTQTKVKLKRTFALEENYGQTVLASPADFNAIFGPWSKMLLRNIRLLCRPGVIFDSGFSDKELAHELRRLKSCPNFAKENYQADVKRQDTSHTPVTLRVFCLLMALCGVPQELCDLYEMHSKRFPYSSMKAGLYKGEARYNLGSGDPFTLIRNICEVATVMVERYGNQMSDCVVVIKGDDLLMDKIPTPLPVSVQEIRDTQLTEAFNAPPYHAGRFLLDDDLVPDPVRMVSKILVKKTSDVDRLNQLAESFYDRYTHLTAYSYNQLRHYVKEAYSDFEPEFPLAALDLYHALRDRSLFYELLSGDSTPDEKKLVVLDKEEDCAVYAVSHFTQDNKTLQLVKGETKEIIKDVCTRRNIPVHDVRGKPNDFLRKGVWLSDNHAWAVIGLTEYKDQQENHEVHDCRD